MLCAAALAAQVVSKNYTYAIKGNDTLKFDLYKTSELTDKPLIVFVFGGGFIKGSRNADFQIPFFQKLCSNGFNVVSIDYRLGLKNAGQPGITNTKPLYNAISIAAEDLIGAVDYIKKNQALLNINADKVVCVGSSAGAITVLQADYFLSIFPPSKFGLSDSLKFDGVVSFSGAIFSKKGKVKWTGRQPAPTLLLHGTADKVVPYKQIRLFNQCFSGSDKLADRFSKFGYPFEIVRFDNKGHEVASMYEGEFDLIISFIDDFVINKKSCQSDIYIKDLKTSQNKTKNTRKQLYKNN